jgi:hypothetical protein
MDGEMEKWRDTEIQKYQSNEISHSLQSWVLGTLFCLVHSDSPWPGCGPWLERLTGLATIASSQAGGQGCQKHHRLLAFQQPSFALHTE